MRILLRCFYFLLTGLFILSSCKQEDNTIGQDLVNSSLRQVLIDTCTVRLSTIFYDSTFTSGQNYILSGSFDDKEFGPTKAVSYVSFSSPGTYLLNPLTAVFDSMDLRLKYNKYYYGDTIPLQNLVINTLDDNIVLYNDNYLFNTTSVKQSSVSIGNATFQPRSGSGGEILIRLDDKFGYDMFSKISNASDTISSADKFAKYFKGLAITPGQSSSSILGFNVDSSYIRIYYHQANDVLSTITLDIHSNKNLQFNQILQNRKGTPLAKMDRNNKEISSNQTNHQVYMQPINAIYPVIEFPYVSQLLKLSSYGSIVRAELELYPVFGTYGPTKPLPSNLTVYITDFLNNPLTPLLRSSSTTESQTGNLTIDDRFNINTKYTFDITDFLRTNITLMGINKQKLQIVLPNTVTYKETNTTLQSLVLGDQNHPSNQIKLKIYYVLYDTK